MVRRVEYIAKKALNPEDTISNPQNSLDPARKSAYNPAGHMLAKGSFLDRLRLEKKRSTRTNEPLSIILFYLDLENSREGREGLRSFLEYLGENTRETDLKGWLERDVVAVLLPDTDEAGLKGYALKIRRGNEDIKYSTVAATYPDDLFQKLLDEKENLPDFFPLDLDAAEGRSGFRLTVKRAIDIAGSLSGLILLLPLMLLIALAVKASSPGPVIFKQKRLGLRGTRFPFYKFRSMVWNNNDRVHRQYVTSLIEGKVHHLDQGGKTKPMYKLSKDSRITPVGKIIRKLSLDELPQLFNVLKGEMSLVGPRPPIPYEVEKYQPWHLRRILEMKPGMTGLWQVSGRSRTTFDEMVRLDLRYVRKWSLGLDLGIMLKTVFEVLKIRNVA